MRNKKGFTLVELIVVIAILGIIAAIAIPSVMTYTKQSNMAVAYSNGKMVLDSSMRIETSRATGLDIPLSAVSIYSESKLEVYEGISPLENSIVVNIVDNKLLELYSMRRGQLAMWTIDRGWVFGEENIEFVEEEDLGLAFRLVQGNTAYELRDGRNFNKEHLYIPSTYNGLPVIQIHNAAFNGLTTLKSVVFPSTIVSIGTSAFHGCTGLTDLVFPVNIEYIGNNAFNQCSNLKNVYFVRSVSDGGVTLTGNDIFKQCHSELKLFVPSNSLNEYKTLNKWSKYTVIAN